MGRDLESLGLPTNDIGFAARRPPVYRKVHSTFQVDQHRRMEAASWLRAEAAKAARMVSLVMSASAKSAGSPDTTNDAIATKSWR